MRADAGTLVASIVRRLVREAQAHAAEDEKRRQLIDVRRRAERRGGEIVDAEPVETGNSNR